MGIKLDAANLCLLAPNGMGKTTIVDALELWSSGDLPDYHRDRCGLDAAINIDRDGPARIVCELDGGQRLERKLEHRTVSALSPVGPVAADWEAPPPIPILRHRTMADFMAGTAGDRKRQLLEFLGLGALIDFGDELRRGARGYKRSADALEARSKEEQATLDLELDGRDLVELGEELRVGGGLEAPVKSQSDLLALEIEAPSEDPNARRRVALDGLVRAVEGRETSPRAAWNRVVADRDVVMASATMELIDTGRRVLEGWEPDTCPLCLQDVDKEGLDAGLGRRALELAEADGKLQDALGGLRSYRTTLARTREALVEVMRVAPSGGWAGEATLRDAERKVEDELANIDSAGANKATLERAVEIDWPPVIKSISEQLDAAAPASRAAALARLARLQDKVRQVEGTSARATKATTVAEAAKDLVEIANREIQAAVEASMERLSEMIGRYYSMLIASPVVADARLQYRDAYSGGVEFSITFDGRHQVSPPQRIVSESQLNALGIATFLARLQVEQQPWRTVVLDDVVNSFDADHRVGLANLLIAEFADWQVIVMTHDQYFADVLQQRGAAGWRHHVIAQWTPQGGPVLTDGDPLNRLKQRLNEGRSPDELGGLARQALERNLARPMARMRLPAPYDARGRHTAEELQRALKAALASESPGLPALEVLERMGAAPYLTNLGAHDRVVDPSLSGADLEQLVRDLDELNAGFRCPACEKKIWHAKVGYRDHQCECGSFKQVAS